MSMNHKLLASMVFCTLVCVFVYCLWALAVDVVLSENTDVPPSGSAMVAFCRELHWQAGCEYLFSETAYVVNQ